MPLIIGGPTRSAFAPISLLAIQSTAGKRYYFSSMKYDMLDPLWLDDSTTTTTTTTATTNDVPSGYVDDGNSAASNPMEACAGTGSQAVFDAASDTSGGGILDTSTYAAGLYSFTGTTPITSGTLTFDWSSTITTGGEVYVNVSTDGGVTWTQLALSVASTSLATVNWTIPANTQPSLLLVQPFATVDASTTCSSELVLSNLGISYDVTTNVTVTTDVPQETVTFLPRLIDPPEFACTANLVTATASCTLENLSGDTVNRNSARLFASDELSGALFVFYIWDPASETAVFTQKGQVDDMDVDDTEFTLDLSTWQNWSMIIAPDCEISNNCQNTFGSQQCGSIAMTSCLNSYGNCTSLNRFKGLIVQWNSQVYDLSQNTGIAQPPPFWGFNGRRLP